MKMLPKEPCEVLSNIDALGLAAYDAFAANKVLNDPDASELDKAAAKVSLSNAFYGLSVGVAGLTKSLSEFGEVAANVASLAPNMLALSFSTAQLFDALGKYSRDECDLNTVFQNLKSVNGVRS